MVAIRHVGTLTNAINGEVTEKKKAYKWFFALFLDVEVEVTGIKGLAFIEYLH